jgi:hypothetical protein
MIAFRANSEKEMTELIRKIDAMAELNERFVLQSTHVSTLEREALELRYSLRRMKGISDGIDHLWQIKEAEYSNVNQLLTQVRLN